MINAKIVRISSVFLLACLAGATTNFLFGQRSTSSCLGSAAIGIVCFKVNAV
jgi:hypothetical protein